MDDQIALFRAYLVKEARTKGRWALEHAADPASEPKQVCAVAAQSMQLESLTREIDLLARDSEGFGVKHGLVQRREEAP